MKKQKKQLLILFLLLVIFIVGYFGLQEFHKKEKIKELQGNTVRAFNNTDILSFSYAYGNKEYALEKQDGQWIYKEDLSLDLDEHLIDGMLTVAANIPISNTVENVTDFDQYGLVEPYITIKCSDGEKEYTVLMGDYNNTISQYYIRVNGENTVYTTDSSLYYTFTKTVENLKEKEN